MNRRIAALETLRRIEERGLTALAQELTGAQSAQAEALRRVDDLATRAVTEAQAQSLEALPYVGRFLATLRREQGRERHAAQALEGRIEGLRDQVIERFTAERRYGKLSDDLAAKITAERAKAVEAALEDLTQARFNR